MIYNPLFNFNKDILFTEEDEFFKMPKDLDLETN